jgi:SAM-dependent methyltransferase
MIAGEAMSASLFERLDANPDYDFYAVPRLVNHIDLETIANLSAYYAEILFPGATVLDLMSSWVSHLPAMPALARVAGLGMNAEELAANPRLHDHVVHDLNAEPTLPYAAQCFDFVFIAVSIQYLVRPVEVCADIARVLRPGGRVVIAMSHRCFPTKAIRAFHGITVAERVTLVGEYLQRAGGFAAHEFVERSPLAGDPLWLVTAARDNAAAPKAAGHS